jgi:glycosyltransferase involved in cell wall biosynthesis
MSTGTAARFSIRAIREQLARIFPPKSRMGRGLRLSASAVGRLADMVAAPWRLTSAILRMARAWGTAGCGIGFAPQGRTVVMLVVSQLHIDPRVRQEARVLAAAGFDVVVMWPELATQIGLPIDWGPGITFERLPPAASRFAGQYPGFLGHEMLQAALGYKPFAFHAHDLPTALVALTAARRTGAHAICDFHEWFSEHVTWSSKLQTYKPLSAWQRAANKWLERFVFNRASAVITVCASIAHDMEDEFGNGDERIHIVRNIPAPSDPNVREYPSLRVQLSLRDGQFLVLYQGGIGPSRALEPVIMALSKVPECVLAIRGPSLDYYSHHYRHVAEQNGVSRQQLVFLPEIPSTDVVPACRGADAGLYTVADLCKSFRHALPNKVFEYLMADLPILTADYPEVRKLVIETGVGLAFDPADPADIAATIRAMMALGRARELSSRIPALLAKLDAGSEWHKVVDIYRSLGMNRVRSQRGRPVGRDESGKRDRIGAGA